MSEIQEPNVDKLERKPAEIKWLARLDGGKPDKSVWQGSISVNETAAQKMETYKEVASRCFKWVAYGAPLRCIDGRPAHDQPDALGPQLAGGAPALAVPLHLSEPRGGREHFIIGDYIEVVKRHDELELAFELGAHRDDHAEGKSVGCGALDKMPQIIEAMASDKTQGLVLDFTKAIMGDAYDEHAASEVCRRLAELNQPEYKDRWLMENDDYEKLTGTPAPEFKKEVLSGIEARAGKQAVETVLGAHKEVLLIINTRRGRPLIRTTLLT